MAEYIFSMDRIRSCYSETKGNCPFCFIAIKIGERHCSLSSCKCLTTKRPKDCPIVEVPTPHGDLIEKSKVADIVDRFIKKAEEDGKDDAVWFLNILGGGVDCIPTIIEASK